MEICTHSSEILTKSLSCITCQTHNECFEEGTKKESVGIWQKKNGIFFLVSYSKKNVDKNVPHNKKLIIVNFLVNLVCKKNLLGM